MVTFTFRGGLKIKVPESRARALQAAGRGTYLTRTMQAAPQAAPQPWHYSEPEIDDDLEGMTVAMLRALADAEGVDLPGRANKSDIIAALRAAGIDG